jgi:hypothetical protein
MDLQAKKVPQREMEKCANITMKKSLSVCLNDDITDIA